jgi:molybdopterin adenylyltransferase
VKAGILTVSDRSWRGERPDVSGEVIAESLERLGEVDCVYALVPDEKALISGKLIEWADSRAIDLILTTGGTGLAPRDVTPEATLAVVDRLVPGMAEAIRAESLKKTPHAMLSRAVCGIRGSCLIVNLPGSPKAVRECLEVILPALPHAIETLRGRVVDCAAPGEEADHTPNRKHCAG